jgi:hypothetical protein
MWFEQYKRVRGGVGPGDRKQVGVETTLLAGLGFDTQRLYIDRFTRAGVDQQPVISSGIFERSDVRIIDARQERGVGVIKRVGPVDQDAVGQLIEQCSNIAVVAGRLRLDGFGARG